MSSSPHNQPIPGPSKPHFFLAPQDRIGVTFPFDDRTIRRLRTIPGCRWEDDKGFWSFPRTREVLEKLLAAFRSDWRILDRSVSEAFGFTKPEAGSAVRAVQTQSQSGSDLEAMTKELRLRNYSPNTIKAYRSCVQSFSGYFAPRGMRELQEEDIKRYLLHQIQQKGLCSGSVSQMLNAIRFLYVEIYKRPFVVRDLQHPKKGRKLPVVLSCEELKALFDGVRNIKHRLILMVAYSAGLRVSEVVRLKTADIDGERKLIHVHSGKGKKDRYTLLSEVVLEGLRDYWKAFRPKVWLFEGQKDGEPYSVRSAEKVFDSAKARAGITKHVTIHSLRHSFATHLLEQGVDIRFIQELLGHRSVRTTEIYTHVSRRMIGAIKSPIDQIIQPRGK